MCKWGITTEVRLCKPTVVQRRTAIKIDACIAPLVQTLNDCGIETTASCCGHGKTEESGIVLSAQSLKIVPREDGSFRVHLVFPYKEGADDSQS